MRRLFSITNKKVFVFLFFLSLLTMLCQGCQQSVQERNRVNLLPHNRPSQSELRRGPGGFNF